MENFILSKLTKEDIEALNKIKTDIRKIPNFPREGILFYDLFSILANVELTQILYDILLKVVKLIEEKSENKINAIIGLESRGFIIGMVLAEKLKIPFIPIRKKNKLPGDCYKVDYTTEYSKDTFELQKNVVNENSFVLIVDDLLATGGTLKASEDLLRLAGAKIGGFLTIFEIEFFKGNKILENFDKSVSLIKIVD
jgi:adenine phosphoribosyltransferase